MDRSSYANRCIEIELEGDDVPGEELEEDEMGIHPGRRIIEIAQLEEFISSSCVCSICGGKMRIMGESRSGLAWPLGGRACSATRVAGC